MSNLLCRIGIHAPEWRPAQFGFNPHSSWIHIRTCTRCGRYLYGHHFIR